MLYTRHMDAERDPNPTEPSAGSPTSSLVPRIIAFDVGDRRIGVAVSDPLGYTAQPLVTLHRTNHRADMKSIARLLRKHSVVEAVVGNPLHMSGDQSPQAAKAQAFAEELRAQFGLTVHLWDERLTTTEAHRHLDAGGHAAGRGRRQIIDQVAAVLILQSFLDARANFDARTA
ncbi:MAG TPA: Holliday junction resolvase RuvX [Acidobacteriaceae bacterium]|nr:Holliday junction resolvase RuvX [Acidobacteriaceae bacterium]